MLKFTILGFLNYGQMTGYELQGHLESSTQGLWHASLSQIYPTLKKLEQAGLVNSTRIPQKGKPDKKTYQITETGKTEFQAWLDGRVHAVARHKNANMLKLFFAGSLTKKRVLHHLQNELELQTEQLLIDEHESKAYIKAIVTVTALQRESVMWQAIRELGLEQRKTTIKWLKATITTVDKIYEEDE